MAEQPRIPYAAWLHVRRGPRPHHSRNACYATGKWPYGRRNSRTGGKHDPATIIEIPIPTLIDPSDFSRAATKLVTNNPRTRHLHVLSTALLCSLVLRSVPPAAQA